MMMTFALLGFSLFTHELDIIKQDTQVLKKELHEERLDRISKYYDDALTPLKEKEMFEKETALKELERFLKEHPHSPQNSSILLSLADLYFDFDLSKTILFSQRFIKDYPTDTHVDAAIYLLGVSYLYEGETENAQKTFQKFLDQHSHSQYADEVRFRLAEIDFDHKDYSAAELELKPLLEKPQSTFYLKALYKSAWMNYLRNQYPIAIHQFAQLLDLDADSNETLRKEATRYLAISLMDSSQTPAQFKEKNWSYSVWVQLGHVLIKADKNKEASEAFQEAILLDPENPYNKELDLKILDLNPNIEFKKSFVAEYLNNPEMQEQVKRVLLELAMETRSVQYYALFINHFPETDNLDQIIFYYSEAAFDTKLYHYAAIGFEQVGQWPGETPYRQRATVNAVYAYGEEIKESFPAQDLSVVEFAKKSQFQGRIPPLMLDYVKAVDLLAQKYPDFKDVPAQLFQAAGIYYSYGDALEADRRFENLITLYPKEEAARVAAHILIAEPLAQEDWLAVAERAKRFKTLSDDFGPLERSAQFKHANKLYAEAKTADEFHQVADLYLAILKENPKTDFADKILFNAAMALDRSNRTAEAENLFEMLYSSFPKSPLAMDAKQQRAAYFEQRLNFEKAASIYVKIAGDRIALLKAALDYEAAQKFEKAAVLFERFIKEYPDSPEVPDVFVKAAKAYHLANDSKNNIRVLRAFEQRYKNKIAQADYLNLEPVWEDYRALAIKAKSSKEQAKQLTFKTEKLVQLQKSYEKIIKNYELSSWTLASIYQIGSLYESLFQALIKAPCPQDIAKIDEESCDEYASLLEDKAFVLEKKAIDAYQLAIDKSQRVTGSGEWILKAKTALYRMKPSEYLPAEALMQEPVIGLINSSEEAQALAMSRLDHNVSDPNARLQMAQIFYAKNQFDAALITLEDSTEKDYLWLGHVYKALGENAKAIASYEQSETPEAYDNLGLLYLEQGELEKGFLNLEKAQKAWPNCAPVELHLGNYYLMAKDYSKAQIAYETALKLEPGLSATYFNMGLLAWTEQRYEAAEQALNNFLETAKPKADLKTRVESYLKLLRQKIQLEKQNHENK